MKDRLSKIITAEGLNPTLLANELGVQRSGVSHILSGRNNPSLDFLQKLLERFTKLNPEWVILGKGQMYKSNEIKVPDSATHTPVEKTPLSPTPPEKHKDLQVAESYNKIVTDAPKIKSQKSIEKIFIFYSDKTFATYLPEE